MDNGSTFVQDGDGQKAKQQVDVQLTYYLRSSVLGQTLAEIEPYDGSRRNGFVYADGQLIATQAVGAVFWQHMDPSLRSRKTTQAEGHWAGNDELDPFDVKVDAPNSNHHNSGSGGGGKSAGGAEARVASLMDLSMCDFATMLVPCSMVENFEAHIGSVDELGQLHWAGFTKVEVLDDGDDDGDGSTPLEPTDSPIGPSGGEDVAMAIAEMTPIPHVPIPDNPKKPKTKTMIVPISAVGRPQNTGGQFTPDQQKQVNDLNERVKKLLQNPDCAKLLGGTKNAAALLNRAQERSANTINPNYRGTKGRFPEVAREANTRALNPNSTNLAFSEQGIRGLQGRNIYLNDRFFTNVGPSQQETVFIHELNRNRGYGGTDVNDYARITKACGTADPYGTRQ